MKKLIDTKLAYRIATCFGAGYLPAAPGTWASLLALAPCALLHNFPTLYFFTFLALFALGLVSARIVSEDSGLADPSFVVIDEFAAVFIVFLFVPMRPLFVLLGFLLFRLFDVLKPAPAKEIERMGRGWGIMLDDIVSAVYSNIILQIIRSL